VYIYSEVSPHHALSLNEIGAVPGGAFKAFWDPVYRISISTKKKDSLCRTPMVEFIPQAFTLRFRICT